MATIVQARKLVVCAFALAGILSASSAIGGTILDSAVTDATVTLNGAIFDRYFPGLTLDVHQDGSIPLDQRIAIDIPLASVPGGEVVTAATLTTDVTSFAATSGDPTLLLYAYAGDGHISNTDGFNGVLVGTSDPITATGTLVINLDTVVINDLLDADATHLGLIWRSGKDGDQVSVVSNDGALQNLGFTSVLTLETVPEPASLLMLGALGLPMLSRRRRR